MAYAIIFEPVIEREGVRVERLPWRCYGPYADSDAAYAALVGRRFTPAHVVPLKDLSLISLEGTD